MDRVNIVQANLEDSQHQSAVLGMLRSYARDPMGNGQDLAEDVQAVLIDKLRTHPTPLIFLALEEPRPIGIAVCFLGFSTFQARPLINIHDLHVVSELQGQGIGRGLLGAVEEKARTLDCCKLTLEVQENNWPALGLYHSFGFDEGVYEAEAGRVLFRHKPLV
jgi:ribosomal protein S18 acetylase RimI-like enzyme